MKSIHPYLTFNGDCEAAFNFYKKVFNSEFQHIGRFGDMPEDSDYQMTDADKKKIMHVSLPLKEGYTLMGSDTSNHYGKATIGTNFSISINADNKEEADQLYAKLSKGGKETMPMQNTFWESYFGMCTDAFGIQWMLSAPPA
ncbi:MAG: VOC family protein [Flavobacteriaceae bacterium]|nr:VOC family protein [Flavobacteriaceae bacterium]|tara:strand:+ start:5564 stop:5989 length:426 start_codon:yes stop_codon:yes gene_type:complete